MYVNEPSEGKVRIIETRAVRPKTPKGPKGEPGPESKGPPVISYLPQKVGKDFAEADKAKSKKSRKDFCSAVRQ